ncbi:MAG: 30S ribosomal protein S20 [Sedimentisphaerales bacterium]
MLFPQQEQNRIMIFLQEIAVAHSLQAKKRARQNIKRRTINRARKSQIKTQIKHFETAVSEGNVEAASEQYKLVAQKLDKTASTSTMHKKTAARKKSRLAKKLNAIKAKSG